MIVRDAARATLAAGTARVWQVRFAEGRDEVISREEGVTEFARRRTRTRAEYEGARFPDVWYDEPRRTPWDPTWILEVLQHAGREERRAEEHLGFATDLLETGEAIVRPGHRWERPARITGDVWLDAVGRVRRVTWRRFDRVRRAQRDAVTWTTTELWGLGLTVEIPPRPPRQSVARSVGQIAWALRPRRAHARGG